MSEVFVFFVIIYICVCLVCYIVSSCSYCSTEKQQARQERQFSRAIFSLASSNAQPLHERERRRDRDIDWSSTFKSELFWYLVLMKGQGMLSLGSFEIRHVFDPDYGGQSINEMLVKGVRLW